MPEKQQRRIVFFLGAGASYGAGATAPIQGGGELPIPTQETFWDTFLRFCRSSKNRDTIESFLFRYFLGYKKKPSRTKAVERRKKLKSIDVEEVFTFLSERNHAPRTSQQFQLYTKQVWEALVEEIGQVFSRFKPNTKTRKVYKELRKQHIRSHDTVVSFNYDVIFEDSVPNNFHWYYEAIDDQHSYNAFRILKPHGSINWEEKEADGQIEVKDFVDAPIIIAPTHLKFIGTGKNDPKENNDSDESDKSNPALQTRIGYLNQSQQIADVWGAMEREMRSAKALVFIGYSFPPSDLYFSSVLRSVLTIRKKLPHVVIVNPDAMAIRARLHSRFSIPLNQIRTFSDLQTFNQISRERLMKMFV
jgi:SIR2-like domain